MGSDIYDPQTHQITNIFLDASNVSLSMRSSKTTADVVTTESIVFDDSIIQPVEPTNDYEDSQRDYLSRIEESKSNISHNHSTYAELKALSN